MYSRKAGATIERIISNACNIVADNHFFNRRFAIKPVPNSFTIQLKLFYSIATIERIISNACNAVTNCYACKAGATLERILSNACNAVGDCYACKA